MTAIYKRKERNYQFLAVIIKDATWKNLLPVVSIYQTNRGHHRHSGTVAQIKTYSYKLKAGTHRPNRWPSEAFGETRTSSRTNLFGVFSCAGSFWSRVDSVCSDSTCQVWEGWLSGGLDAIGYSNSLSCSMTILIGGVLANQRGVWEGQNKPLFPSWDVYV